MKGDLGNCFSDGSKSGVGIGLGENGKREWSSCCLEVYWKSYKEDVLGIEFNSIYGVRRSCMVWFWGVGWVGIIRR